MDIIEELAKQIEISSSAQARELAAQVVAIVEQARLGVKNPALFVWSVQDAPDILKEFIPEPTLKAAQWIAMSPPGDHKYPFLGEFTQTFQLADGKRIIVY